MAPDTGRSLRKKFVVMYAHVVRNPSLIASQSVDSAEFPSASYRNALCCAMVVLGMTCVVSTVVGVLFLCWVVGDLLSIVSLMLLLCHSVTISCLS